MAKKKQSIQPYEAMDRVEVISAEIYRRQLKIDALKQEIDDYLREREPLLKLLHEYGVKLNEPNIRRIKKMLDNEATRPITIPKMIRTLLEERFNEGMTTNELIKDINARWGRFQSIKETSIRMALSRLHKGGDGSGEIFKQGNRWEITDKSDNIEWRAQPERSGKKKRKKSKRSG